MSQMRDDGLRRESKPDQQHCTWHEPIDPVRLCHAADAALRASIEYAIAMGTGRPDPMDLIEHPMEPPYLRLFSVDEIIEASIFLERLGLSFTRLGENGEQ